MLAGVLKVGSKIPEFSLQDHNKKVVSSSDLLAKGRLVLCFIRWPLVPFLRRTTRSDELHRHTNSRAGAELVAISPLNHSAAPSFMADQHHLRFHSCSLTPTTKWLENSALFTGVPDEQQALYRRTFVNLPLASRDDGWELPIPARLLWTTTAP